MVVQGGIDITSSFILLHGFDLLALLPLFLETTAFISTNKVDLLYVRPNLENIVIVAKTFLNLPQLYVLI